MGPTGVAHKGSVPREWLTTARSHDSGSRWIARTRVHHNRSVPRAWLTTNRCNEGGSQRISPTGVHYNRSIPREWLTTNSFHDSGSQWISPTRVAHNRSSISVAVQDNHQGSIYDGHVNCALHSEESQRHSGKSDWGSTVSAWWKATL